MPPETSLLAELDGTYQPSFERLWRAPAYSARRSRTVASRSRFSARPGAR
jgi:hypothetical protein